LDIPLSKIRRWSKEFLPSVSKVSLKPGYARKFSPNDGFFIYLGGYTVSEFGLTFDNARKVLEILKPWLLMNGLVPDIPNDACRVGIDREIQQDVTVSFVPCPPIPKPDMFIQIGGKVGTELTVEVDSVGRKYEHRNYERMEYTIGSIRGEPMKFEVQHVSKFGLIFHRPKRLYVMSMLDKFNMFVLGNDRWFVNWQSLAKKDPRKAEEKIRQQIEKARMRARKAQRK
jgi:hypothetical protein